MKASGGKRSSLQMPLWVGPTVRIVLDVFRPGSTTVGWLFPVLVVLVTLALLTALLGQVVIPWAIYPAL